MSFLFDVISLQRECASKKWGFRQKLPLGRWLFERTGHWSCINSKCLRDSCKIFCQTLQQKSTKTTERPGNHGSTLLIFEHHCLYAMHGNAAFSNDALVEWYVFWPHFYWELQKIIFSPQQELTSIFWEPSKSATFFEGSPKTKWSSRCGKTTSFCNSR